jgi:hypothetical protein
MKISKLIDVDPNTKLETISTCGGFNALYFPHPLGREKYGYFLITDSMGEQPPIVGQKCAIGWYTDDAQFLGYLDVDQWEQL